MIIGLQKLRLNFIETARSLKPFQPSRCFSLVKYGALFLFS